MKQTAILCVAALACLTLAEPGRAGQTQPAEPVVLALMGSQHLQQRLAADRRTLERCRQSLQELLRYMASRPDVFPAEKLPEKRLLSGSAKIVVRSAWQRLSDNLLALEAIKQANGDFYKIKAAPLERESFRLFCGAFFAQHRYGLQFIAITENDPSLDVVLNEAAPELGLREGAYADLKFHYLNVAIAAQFAALEAARAYYKEPADDGLAAAMRDDRQYIWSRGWGQGEKLTAKNGLRIVQRAGFAAWLPVQQGVSEWMGDTKVWRRDAALISQRQIRDIAARLEPGDLLFERREWYLSNVGLPGFWAHAALYVGTPQERRAFFAGDEELCAWLARQGARACDFEKLLKVQHPAAYALCMQAQEAGHAPRVIEAISEGVSFTTLEHSAACDSLAVLRPRLSKKEKARAVAKAFAYSGRPYDFNFDFLTDASLVCSELLYKCYEPAPGFTGLTFPLQDMLGRMVTPPNDMVRQFDSRYGTPGQQTDFVLFYDGREFERKAVASSVEEFRKSWARPKWHVLTKEGNKKTPKP